MQFLVLGAAAGGGLPQWNCGCPNCNDARTGKIPSASQSSLAVSVDGNNWAVLNASPDIRMQMQACPRMHPRSLRDTPISSVLLTNGDIDHIAGLLSLREQTPFTLFGTSEILDLLTANRVFDAVNAEKVSRRSVAIGASFMMLSNLEAQVFPVPGKVPLFMEGETVKTDLVGEQTVGVRLSDGTHVAYYIPGCAEVTEDLLTTIEDADQLFFDGTLWQDDEMIQSGTGVKTGQRMGHISISGPDGSIAQLAHLKARKTFIHINNTNPVWQPNSPERAFVLENGWDIAADGMEIAL
ncbi:pyrroloquinoline quinone biosynthesis protein PqqB [Phaeobacter gallaeciensis]|uniref:Coenzyme PQQ synthesis protein B n=2 Tax=Roseobacteraceae TaxID=2854170 RepID=A0A366X6R8_9RHOB|nr:MULTISPECIES: pyrroloquinoline quinone biosynthesis protein PqqB [Roseobacteraceae]MBT3142374.1 pyrroloquinoline quinone biosynthesis protein PqqB [Falsiruegeria litorea]MBT8169398.1 pyrroloquinoline quinone biosynthesis protein PqqB [Falsiruegeria litorea]RBW60628.1 pyrroloquinoline quinone biosynthesis protein PqqB [Phaeobacter gallaeciensis]